MTASETEAGINPISIMPPDEFRNMRRFDVLYRLPFEGTTNLAAQGFCEFSGDVRLNRFNPIALARLLSNLNSLPANTRTGVIESLDEMITSPPQFYAEATADGIRTMSISDKYWGETEAERIIAADAINEFFEPVRNTEDPQDAFGLLDYYEEPEGYRLADEPEIKLNRLHKYLQKTLATEETQELTREGTPLSDGAFLSAMEKGLYSLTPEGGVKEAVAGFLVFSREMQTGHFEPISLARMLSGLSTLPVALRTNMCELIFEPLMDKNKGLLTLFLKRFGYPAKPLFNEDGLLVEPDVNPKPIAFSSCYIKATGEQKMRAIRNIRVSFKRLGVEHAGLLYGFGLLQRNAGGGVVLQPSPLFSLNQFYACIGKLIKSPDQVIQPPKK